jgi:hypothetical protein
MGFNSAFKGLIVSGKLPERKKLLFRITINIRILREMDCLKIYIKSNETTAINNYFRQ